MLDGPWKLVLKAKGQTGGPALYQLYDDLAEKNDLAGKQSARVKQMLAAIAAWQQQVGSQDFKSPPR